MVKNIKKELAYSKSWIMDTFKVLVLKGVRNLAWRAFISPQQSFSRNF